MLFDNLFFIKIYKFYYCWKVWKIKSARTHYINQVTGKSFTWLQFFFKYYSSKNPEKKCIMFSKNKKLSSTTVDQIIID